MANDLLNDDIDVPEPKPRPVALLALAAGIIGLVICIWALYTNRAEAAVAATLEKIAFEPAFENRQAASVQTTSFWGKRCPDDEFDVRVYFADQILQEGETQFCCSGTLGTMDCTLGRNPRQQ